MDRLMNVLGAAVKIGSRDAKRLMARLDRDMRHHVHIEETLIFPALQRTAVDSLLIEHQHILATLRELQEGVMAGAWEAADNSLDNLRILVAAHNRDEERSIYRVADRELSETERHRVLAAFFFREGAGLTPFELAAAVVYGPIVSRRLGISLGVNLLPAGRKVCSFDCGYCQCGPSTDDIGNGWPTPSEVRRALEASLKELRACGVELDAITLSGNGEPTLNPRFKECVLAVLRSRDQWVPRTRVGALSNGVHLDRADVVEGMNLLDRRYIKLDAGTEAIFQAVNRPRSWVALEDVVRLVKRLNGFIAQSMFVVGRVDNTSPASVDEWVDVCARARPSAVHLYSISRVPVDKGLRPVSHERLEEIAACLTEKAGIPAEVF